MELKSGIDIVLNAIQLDKELKNADIVVTGEGRLDAVSYTHLDVYKRQVI